MKTCRTCHQATRPDHSSIVDHPGTVRAGKDGQCASCRRRTLEALRKSALPKRPLTADQLAVRRMAARRCTPAEFPTVAEILGVAS